MQILLKTMRLQLLIDIIFQKNLLNFAIKKKKLNLQLELNQLQMLLINLIFIQKTKKKLIIIHLIKKCKYYDNDIRIITFKSNNDYVHIATNILNKKILKI